MIRMTTARRVLDVLAASSTLTGVDVLDAIPVQNVPRECIAFGSIDGESMELPQIRGSARRPFDDYWTMHLVVHVATPGATSFEARTRCEAIASAVWDLVADDPAFRSPTPISGLISVQPQNCLGPNSYPRDEMTGFNAEMTLLLSCHSHIVN